MEVNLKSLFKKESVTTPEQNKIPMAQNPNNKQVGETYHRWGLRVCAIVDGSSFTLAPYLHNVYNYIYNEQVNNQALQETQRKELECQIEQKNNDINNLKKQLESNREQKENCKNWIAELKEEKKKIENEKYCVNKEAKLKLIIGLVILIPLTFYLFLFYSSTFYSAFFKDFTENANVLNSMFDAEALNKAFAASVTELGFVLCAPIIFMGLGFALHFFTIQKGKMKYIKMAAILCVTFIFDAILAYMIGKHLHEMAVIIGTASLNSTYGLSEALGDINTWAVIFCGFIVYIIWGIVFDMVMSAYGQLDLNKVNIRAIEEKIASAKKDIAKHDAKELGLNNEIKQTNNQKSVLLSQIKEKVLIDKAAIKLEMNNFYAGWMVQMGVLGKDKDEKQKAKDTFDITQKTLFS